MIGIRMAAAVALALSIGAAPAWAQTATRAWVSGHGADAAGCGSPANPCRSLQYTHDHIVAAGGEIDILDPAGYGSVSITKAISIINDGVGSAGVQAASGVAITIAAGPTDAVILRGLNIEGVGASSGILFNTGGSLTVQDSAISRFSFAGIQFEPSGASSLYVSNTRVTDNVHVGINIVPIIASGSATVRAVVYRSEGINDGDAGVWVDGRSSSQSVIINATVADSLMSTNGQGGVISINTASGATTTVVVRNCTLTLNNFGVAAQGAGASLYIGRSTLNGNSAAFGAFSSAVLGSYGDNNADGNGSVGSTPTPATLH